MECVCAFMCRCPWMHQTNTECEAVSIEAKSGVALKLLLFIETMLAFNTYLSGILYLLQRTFHRIMHNFCGVVTYSVKLLMLYPIYFF